MNKDARMNVGVVSYNMQYTIYIIGIICVAASPGHRMFDSVRV
jgi:hypothetical protein